MKKYMYRAELRKLNDDAIKPKNSKSDVEIYEHIEKGINTESKYISFTEGLDIALFKYNAGKENSKYRGDIYAVDIEDLEDLNVNVLKYNDEKLSDELEGRSANNYVKADKEIIVEGKIPKDKYIKIPQEIAELIYAYEQNKEEILKSFNYPNQELYNELEKENRILNAEVNAKHGNIKKQISKKEYLDKKIKELKIDKYLNNIYEKREGFEEEGQKYIWQEIQELGGKGKAKNIRREKMKLEDYTPTDRYLKKMSLSKEELEELEKKADLFEKEKAEIKKTLSEDITARQEKIEVNKKFIEQDKKELDDRNRKTFDMFKDYIIETVKNEPDKINDFLKKTNKDRLPKEENTLEIALDNFKYLYYEKALNMSEIVRRFNEGIDRTSDEYLERENIIYGARAKYILDILKNEEFKNEIFKEIVEKENLGNIEENVLDQIFKKQEEIDLVIFPKDYTVKTKNKEIDLNKENREVINKGKFIAETEKTDDSKLEYKIHENIYIKEILAEDLEESKERLKNTGLYKKEDIDKIVEKNKLENLKNKSKKIIPTNLVEKEDKVVAKYVEIERMYNKEGKIKKDNNGKYITKESEKGIDLNKTYLLSKELTDEKKDYEINEKIDQALDEAREKTRIRKMQLKKVNKEILKTRIQEKINAKEYDKDEQNILDIKEFVEEKSDIENEKEDKEDSYDRDR